MSECIDINIAWQSKRQAFYLNKELERKIGMALQPLKLETKL